MFAAVVASAWLATGWCRVPPDIGARVTMGSVALALVLLAELAMSPFVRGNVERWFESFTPFTHIGAQSRSLGGAGLHAPDGVARRVAGAKGALSSA